MVQTLVLSILQRKLKKQTISVLLMAITVALMYVVEKTLGIGSLAK